MMNNIFQKNEAISRPWYEMDFEDSYLAGEMLRKKNIFILPNLKFSLNIKFLLVLVFLMRRFPRIDTSDLDLYHEEWFNTCWVMPNDVND